MDTGTEIITESLIISDYLDQKYPHPPLYPKDDEQKKVDKQLIDSFGDIIGLYSAAVWNKENKHLSEHVTVLKPEIEKLENELEKRGMYI